MREVVVTGIGAVTPVGLNASDSWHAVLEGQSGITKLPEELVHDLPVKIGGLVPSQKDTFDTAELVARGDLKASDSKRLDTHALFGISAGFEAVRSALGQQFRVGDKHPFNPQKFGVSLGSSAGPVGLFQEATRILDARGPRRVPPGVSIYGGSDAAASYLSMQLDAQGTSLGIGATCASGAVALGEALRAIRHGYLDAVLVVGAEDCLNRVNLASNVGIRSLTTNFSAEPTRASRPFDSERSGFVMSQGAAAVLLESAEGATRRGAKVLAKIAGYGTSSDAFHATAPHPSGRGASQAMKAALKDSEINAAQIDHINAHGTSTVLGDKIEAIAMQNVFGVASVPPITATKSVVGHMLGAAGVFEAIVALKSLETAQIPPTINLETSDFDLDIVAEFARTKQMEAVMSNSFGFGGHNVSLIFTK